jgi:2-dehydropantoate 2-reductase
MSSSQPMDVAVLGPGGVGGLLAALLAQAGDRVVCLAGESTVTALRKRGLTVRSERFGSVSASVGADTALREPADICVICVKATQLDAALQRVPTDAVAAGIVIPFLNGIEHVDVLRRRFGRGHVVAGTIRVESTRVAPGVIEQVSPFAAIELGAPDSEPAAGLIARFAQRLSEVGFDVGVRADERAMLWEKLSFLAPMALVTTHAGVPVGLARTDHRDDLLGAVHEAAAVATRDGAAIDDAAVMQALDGVPATMQSSMQRDAAAGRELELDAVGGAVLRIAARLDVPTPVTSRLMQDLRSRSRTA